MDKQNRNIRSKYTVRTSDRRTCRRCMRKWDYMASMRKNLTPKGTEQNINFWFGSAIHFAMEDYHGYNKYGDPRRAFYAYYNAFDPDTLPPGAEAHYELGMAMLSYYLTWYPRYNAATEFETVWLDPDGNDVLPFTEGAKPCVEQGFMLPLNVRVIVDKETDVNYAKYIPGSENKAGAYATGTLLMERQEQMQYNEQDHTYDLVTTDIYTWVMADGTRRDVHLIPIYYHGTIDRIVKDKYGRYWLLDYKTAKSADTNKLDTDDQINAYIWAATILFQRPIYGFVYMQLTKAQVQEPRRLKNGTLSVDKKQKTTYSLLRKEILHDYGRVEDAPNKLIQFLNDLASRETPEGDGFIRWDFVKRNEQQIINTAKAIYAELDLMLDPTLYCFPNPTRDCIWDCPVREACIAQDRGDEDTVIEFFRHWEERPRTENGNIEDWREDLPSPEEVNKIPLEDILEAEKMMVIELESNKDESGFTFMFGDDEDDRR